MIEQESVIHIKESSGNQAILNLAHVRLLLPLKKTHTRVEWTDGTTTDVPLLFRAFVEHLAARDALRAAAEATR